jgi:hypothetical protein
MIAAFGFLAAALSIAVIWPQAWRSCRHGRTLLSWVTMKNFPVLDRADLRLRAGLVCC